MTDDMRNPEWDKHVVGHLKKVADGGELYRIEADYPVTAYGVCYQAMAGAFMALFGVPARSHIEDFETDRQAGEVSDYVGQLNGAAFKALGYQSTRNPLGDFDIDQANRWEGDRGVARRALAYAVACWIEDGSVPPPIWAIVTEDSSGSELAKYKVAAHEVLSTDDFAKRYCEANDLELSQADGHVPRGCADFTVTLTEDETGKSVRCWSSQSYFYERE